MLRRSRKKQPNLKLPKLKRRKAKLPKRLRRGKKYARTGRTRRFRSDKPGTVLIQDGTILWTLPRKLRSPNQIKTGLARYGDTKGWEAQFVAALVVGTDDSIGMGKQQRLKLEVVRRVPRKDFFLDRTNLAFSVKGLEDALVRLGYLVDDNEDWLDGPYVTQDVSDDKKYWTIVKISELTSA